MNELERAMAEGLLLLLEDARALTPPEGMRFSDEEGRLLLEYTPAVSSRYDHAIIAIKEALEHTR